MENIRCSFGYMAVRKRGNWGRRYPDQNPLLLNSVLSEGYALAAVDYRLSGRSNLPKTSRIIMMPLTIFMTMLTSTILPPITWYRCKAFSWWSFSGLVGASNMHGDISFYSESKYRVAELCKLLARRTC
ncbi:hypothetical protein OH492_14820 [Vibrio chagasii]|nr:hypothetical protein [Vibrio chagasii]